MDTENSLNGTQMVELLSMQNEFGLKIMQGSKINLADRLGILVYTASVTLENMRREVNKWGCNYSYEEFLELIKEVHVKNEASMKEFKSLCNGKEK